MDSFEINKIAGAILAALLLVFGSATLIDIIKGKKSQVAGYTLPVPKGASGVVGAVGADTAITVPKIAELMTKASVEGGAGVFKKCATCHTPDKGGKNGTGPNLWNLVGRKISGVEGFAYSNASKAKGGEWSWENLIPYINAPAAWMPGNKMAFAGIKDPGELAELMVYLRTLGDTPAALPK